MLNKINIKNIQVSVGITEDQEKRLETLIKTLNSRSKNDYLTIEKELSYIMQVDCNSHIETVLQKLEKEVYYTDILSPTN